MSCQKNKTKEGSGGSFLQIPVNAPSPPDPPLKFNSEETVFMQFQCGIKEVYDWQSTPAPNPLTPLGSPRISCFLQIFRPATPLTGRHDNTLGQPAAIKLKAGPSLQLPSRPDWRELGEEAVPGQLHSLAVGRLAGWLEWA